MTESEIEAAVIKVVAEKMGIDEDDMLTIGDVVEFIAKHESVDRMQQRPH